MEITGEGASADSSSRSRVQGTTIYLSPLLQFVTLIDPLIKDKLRVFVEQHHRKRMQLGRICLELYHYARSLGFQAVISAHEVETVGVLSHEGAVKSALIIIELQRIEPDRENLKWMGLAWLDNEPRRSTFGDASSYAYAQEAE